MTVTSTISNNCTLSGHIRSFNVQKDLSQVADLVEQCFADTLDAEGWEYLRQMRSAAHNPVYLKWAKLASDQVSLPLTGFVWETEGTIVGNLSLIPFHKYGQRRYLIANVSVHPDYRLKGIARKMTEAALEQAESRHADSIWLHVRDDNKIAFELYRSFGFIERTRRTTWCSERGDGDHGKGATKESFWNEINPFKRLYRVESGLQKVLITRRRTRDWNQQRAWLNKDYPQMITWNMKINTTALRSGLIGYFYRMFMGVDIRQWSIRKDRRLVGVLAWQRHVGHIDSLWLAVDPDEENAAACHLLAHARRQLPERSLRLNFPCDRASEAIEAASFQKRRTLIWMEMQL